MTSPPARTIELVSESADGEWVNLTMTVTGRWDGSHDRLREIQARVNDYLAFALDGQLSRDFPKLANKKVRIDLVTPSHPDSHSMKFLNRVGEVCRAEAIEFRVTVAKGIP